MLLKGQTWKDVNVIVVIENITEWIISNKCYLLILISV